MDLKEYCYSLSKEKLSGLALKLCDRAYAIWEGYCEATEVQYRDTVIGELHIVNKSLLSDTLILCHNLQSEANSDLFKNQAKAMLEKLLEPVTAIQDGDWNLPDHVEKTFYSVYNLIKGFDKPKSQFGELSHYLSVNQSVDAIYKSGLMSFDELKSFIYNIEK